MGDNVVPNGGRGLQGSRPTVRFVRLAPCADGAFDEAVGFAARFAVRLAALLVVVASSSAGASAANFNLAMAGSSRHA
jgi:hypothetical protein